MQDESILRDLNRIINDRGVSQTHRNVVRRAIVVITQLESGEPAIDPDQTDYRANFEALKKREDQHLKLLGDDI